MICADLLRTGRPLQFASWNPDFLPLWLLYVARKHIFVFLQDLGFERILDFTEYVQPKVRREIFSDGVRLSATGPCMRLMCDMTL